MMSIEVKDKASPKTSFPKLRRNVVTGAIALWFSENGTNRVYFVSSQLSVPCFMSDSSHHAWEDYEGEVILKNA